MMNGVRPANGIKVMVICTEKTIFMGLVLEVSSQEDLLMRHHIQCNRFGKEKMKCQTCLQPSMKANDSKIVQVD